MLQQIHSPSFISLSFHLCVEIMQTYLSVRHSALVFGNDYNYNISNL